MGHIVAGAILSAVLFTPSFLRDFSIAKTYEDKDASAKRIAAYWAGCLLTAGLTMLFYLLL